jgi:hypothetical protein
MDHRGRREHFGNLPLASRSSNPRRYLLPPLQTDIEIMGLAYGESGGPPWHTIAGPRGNL